MTSRAITPRALNSPGSIATWNAPKRYHSTLSFTDGHLRNQTTSQISSMPYFVFHLMPEANRAHPRERQTSFGLLLLQVPEVVLPPGHTLSRGLYDTALPMSLWFLLGGGTGPRSDRFCVQPRTWSYISLQLSLIKDAWRRPRICSWNSQMTHAKRSSPATPSRTS